jgi:hypothetical protein
MDPCIWAYLALRMLIGLYSLTSEHELVYFYVLKSIFINFFIFLN